MVSPPEYHYRKGTLTFPVVRVTGDSWTGSAGWSLTVRKRGFEQRYPTGTLANPLEDGHVLFTVTSDYHEGWRSYFESRTDGEVTHDLAN